jgi:hypothetical protein
MTLTDDAGRTDVRSRAEQEARARALAAPSGIGAAYLWQPAGEVDRVGWAGRVVVSDGTDVVGALVTTIGQSRYATPNPEQLALAVERIVIAHGGSLREAVASLERGGLGIDLDAPRHLPRIFS